MSAYEMRISVWSSDGCSSYLRAIAQADEQVLRRSRPAGRDRLEADELTEIAEFGEIGRQKCLEARARRLQLETHADEIRIGIAQPAIKRQIATIGAMLDRQSTRLNSRH